MRWNLSISLCLIVAVLFGCTARIAPDPSPQSGKPLPAITDLVATGVPVVSTYKVITTYPHDQNASTQGLVLDKGVLYEGTGLYGHSTLRKVELKTGRVLQIRELPAQFFGEGITIHGNRVIQLTWQSGIAFVYDKDSFELLRDFRYPYEGWGITCDGNHLIMSDGTAILHVLDAETFREIRRIEVHDNNGPVTNLNELEYVQGELYANVWQTDRIAKIAPDTGRITGWINLEGLLSPQERSGPIGVLNGIAYDSTSGSLLVTGKLWPKLFEIREIPNN